MSFHELVERLQEYAGFGPGIVIALVLSLLACGYVSRAMRISIAHGWALLMSLGVVMAATITPSREALLFGAQGSGTCDLSTIAPGSWWELRHINETSLNILLFVPIGIAIGLLPKSRARLIALVAALVLPVAIEVVQLVVAPLDRACQGSDVADNVIGLLLGLGTATVVRWIWQRRPDSRAENSDGGRDK